MKTYLTTALALACAVLLASLALMKRSDDTQHQTDTDAIASLSNQLDSAETQITIDKGAVIILSNRFDECQSAVVAFSNQLTDARSAITAGADQITNLTRHVAELESENQNLNQTLGQRVTDLTNQVAGLTTQLALTATNLARANEDYARLENRLRRDVAERVVVERKFNNPSELKAQMQKLKENTCAVISAEGIYAGLDVEVKSNSFHVLSPN